MTQDPRKPGWPEGPYKFGDLVRKPSGSSWRGIVVGWYKTPKTALGYAVASVFEPNAVQIYPATALQPWDGDST
jgi:hypothetical protein